MKRFRVLVVLLLLALVGGTAAYFIQLGEWPFRREVREATTEPTQDQTAPPSFDVVRVERTGELVIAGVAPPGWIVRIESDDAAIGEMEAEFDGAWVMVPEAPLSRGEHSLRLSARSPDGSQVLVSPQRVAVSISGESEPAVVALSGEGEATRVLQSGAEASPPAIPADAGDERIVAADQTPAAQQGAGETETVGEDAAAGARDVASVQASPSAPASSGVQATVSEDRPASVSSLPDAAQRSAAEVTFSAIDFEDDDAGGRLFMSGAASPDTRIALYVNNQFVGATDVDETGAWIFTLSDVGETGQLELRADQLDAGSGRVMARAEVSFERPPLATASIPEPVTASASASATAPVNREASGAPTQPDQAGAQSAAVEQAPTQTRTASLADDVEPSTLTDEERTATSDEQGGRAIIVRKGDTLWHIARRHYGSGVRYTKIFRSNRDQIRNPNRIYPNQEFILPR